MGNINKKLALLLMGCMFVGIILTNSCKKEPILATLTTSSVTDIKVNSATTGGLISKDGGAAVTVRGVCWGSNASPSLSGSHTSNDKGTGSFTSRITDLTPNTLYHIRAYATNSVGTAYGNEVTFTTSPIVPATLITTDISAISQTSAVSGGNITADGNGAVTARGICWATTTAPTVANSLTTDGTGTGTYISNLTGLLPATKYYVRAYATNSAGNAYGNEISFTTSAIAIPALTTTAASAITLTTATSGGNITADGGGAITAKGVCWATTTSPTTTGSKTSNGTGSGTFSSSLTGLLPGTLYYIRAYATNSVGTAYGNELTFTTTPVALPSLTTTAVTSITLTTAISGGNITADGGGAVTTRGVCWATTTSPTTSNSKTADGTGTGSFSSNLTGLLPGTTYYIRAYATNSAGTAYGNEFSFATALAAVPTLTTTTVTSITLTTASSGGNITADGGGSVTARGTCWANTANPTISNSKSTDGTGTGIFTSSLTGLLPGTLYHVRAYATNSAGTAYGNDLTFTTTSVSLATVTTASATSITITTATSGGNVTADGGGTVTARGTCWATTTSPTIAGSKTSDGTGTGSFVSSLTGLLPGTTYYARAYATNGAGTAYGNEISFTTNPIATPTLTTTSISAVGLTAAISGGNITSDGGGAVSARGACWSTTTNPTILGSKTTDGTGIGVFTSNVTGLTQGTIYYLRAYATNSAGTSYGNQVRFSTNLSDVDGNTYRTIVIGTQLWMAEDLKTTKFNDNSTILNITDNAAWAGDSIAMTPAYCWYNNDPSTYKPTYGALYNWYAANTGNLCPTGWHTPSDGEFNTLEATIGMSLAQINLTYVWRGTNQGTQLKNTTGWIVGNGTNTVGFSALPGGYRYGADGSFNNLGDITYWWLTTEELTNTAWYRRLDGNQTGIYKAATHKWGGKFVRCLKN